MAEDNLQKISATLNIPLGAVSAVAKLLGDGATVPFIARYRKEATGSLDEVAIAAIRDEGERLAALDDRRAAIKKSLDERKLLTAELSAALDNAETLAKIEDIYQPYRPKRRTRATIARERGLQPLADFILENQNSAAEEKASEFVDGTKEVADIPAALAGARDIIAETVSDDASARGEVRDYFARNAVMTSRVITGKEAEGAKYRDYFNWSEPLSSAPSHRILAVRRGEAEGFLMMSVAPESPDGAVAVLKKLFVKGSGGCAEQVALACTDAYNRLLASSTETYMRLEAKKRADAEAVKVFANNLRELLMASPLGRKNVLAIDPGFRTGCKVVCLNRQGDLVHHDVIFPEQGQFKLEEARQKILAYCVKYSVEAVAIGNGTAGRETEAFVRSLGLPQTIAVVMVNESGASIYSASEVAREEFPQYDITVRGAVSIGRRLMDPLAELVKIDPQSIGVGQYQHDVNQTMLKKQLDDVVVSCVNSVGVEVNTASRQLLAYVSGLNSSVAQNIVEYRNANGPFKLRADLLKVKGLGAKAFEMSAGFLRIRDGSNPLDASAVHPERYGIVEKMAQDIGCDIPTLLREPSARAKIDVKKYVSGDVGLPTLKDILAELNKPGRDPRKQFEVFSFKEGVNKISDLQEGMRLPGIVTNVTAFGAFVDIGVHQDGLVHISELSDTFVKDPNDVVKPQQRVNVYVLEVDLARNRIALSMKSNPQKRVRSASDAARDGAASSGQRRPQGAFARYGTSGRGGSASGGFTRRSSEPFGNSFGDAFDRLGKK